MAVLDRETLKPIVLIEMKYEDHETAATHKQIADYLQYCQSENVQFRYITQFSDIPRNDTELLQRQKYKGICSHITYETIYRILIPHAARSPIIRLFCEYLRENTAMFEPIRDIAALKLMMVRSLGIAHFHGLGRLHANDRVLSGIPRVFQQSLHNMEALSNATRRAIEGEYFRQSSVIQYTFKPEFSRRSVANWLDKIDDDWISFDSKLIRYGYYYVYSNNRIATADSNDYLYLEFGMYYYLDTSERSSPLSSYLYSSVYGKGASGEPTYCEARNALNRLETCRKSMLKLIGRSTDSAIQLHPKRYRNSLQSIRAKLQ
jgi:hypothetical protein